MMASKLVIFLVITLHYDYDFLKINDFDGDHGDGVHDDGGLRDDDSYIMIFLLIIIRVNIFFYESDETKW